MFGFFILILLACVICGCIFAGCFGDKLYDKTEDVKNIYTQEGEENNEQER